MSRLNFDSTGIDPMKQFEPIPPDEYTLAVTESDIRTSSKTGNEYLSLTLAVVEDGPFKNRKIFDIVMMKHPDAEVVEMGKKKLAAICRAVGKPRIKDSSELHNRPLRAKVGVQEAKDGYDAKNVIKAYLFDEEKKPASARQAKPARAAEAETDDVSFDDDDIPFK